MVTPKIPQNQRHLLYRPTLKLLNLSRDDVITGKGSKGLFSLFNSHVEQVILVYIPSFLRPCSLFSPVSVLLLGVTLIYLLLSFVRWYSVRLFSFMILHGMINISTQNAFFGTIFPPASDIGNEQ